MRHILTLLVVASVTVALPAAADEPASSPDPTVAAAATGNGAALAPQTTSGLANVHGGLSAQSARVAGTSREIELAATPSTAGKPLRPAPTPRALRKMGTERAIAAVDANVRACASESTVMVPTTFGLRVSVAPGGEVEGVELASPTRITPALFKCVASAVGSARFGSPGAAGASIAVPVTVPGRPAPLATATAPVAPSVTVTVITPAVVSTTPDAPVASK